MLAIVKNNLDEAPMTVPTIAEIARAVPRGAALQAAELKITSLRGRRDAVGAEIACGYEALKAGGGDPVRKTLMLLEAEKAAIQENIKKARIAAAELRLARSRKVAAALADHRLAAARRLLAATDELTKAFAELRECNEESRLAGDTDAPCFFAPNIGLVWNHAQQIVRAAE